MGCIYSNLLKHRQTSNSNIPFIHYEIYENYLKNFKIVKRFEFNEYVYKIMENNRSYILKIHYSNNSFDREYKILNMVKSLKNTIDLYKIIRFSERDVFNGGLILYNYIPGIDLFTFFTNNKNLSKSIKKNIFINIVNLLKNLHTLDIQHGDLKLENIICKYNNYNDLYLIDFGLSRHCTRENKHHKCFGTIPYMAPEICEGFSCLKSDIWSLGCILYVLIFNCLPFSNRKNDYKVIISNIYEYIDNLKNCAKNKIDSDLFNLIFGMLEPDVHKRLDIFEISNNSWIVN